MPLHPPASQAQEGDFSAVKLNKGLGKNAFPHFISLAKAQRRKEKRGNPPAEPFSASLRLCEILG